MKHSNRVTKKGPGRPKSTGIGTQIGMRWHEPVLKRIDAWRGKQADQPERPEAIRRLVEQGLTMPVSAGAVSADGPVMKRPLSGKIGLARRKTKA